MARKSGVPIPRPPASKPSSGSWGARFGASVAVVAIAAAAAYFGRDRLEAVDRLKQIFVPEAASAEGWRLSGAELRKILSKHEQEVDKDLQWVLKPSPVEARLLGSATIEARGMHAAKARTANRRFIEAIIADGRGSPADSGGAVLTRPVANFTILSGVHLKPKSYSSLASLFVHLMRDWSDQRTHVYDSQYALAIRLLREFAATGADVLVPGCGLARLALEVAAEGYRVEANEDSRLFLTVADHVLNRARARSHLIYPMESIWSYNFDHGQQYMNITLPLPLPGVFAARQGSLAGGPAVTIIPGDFVKLYGRGRPGHRKFGAIITSFFIDTAWNIAELVEILDDLLLPGGVWINVGVLFWRKDARLKLNWEEVLAMWSNLGYTFHGHERFPCEYSLPLGVKMFAEAYMCVRLAAVKPSHGTSG